ncbi:hypothetical protein [Vibrio harveyi]
MKNFIQRHHSTLSLLVKHLIQTPAVLLLVIAAYVLATDIHFNYNQGSVTAVTEAAWLGKAEKGQIRIFECTDGTPIDRATIVGNANPCPNSEVKNHLNSRLGTCDHTARKRADRATLFEFGDYQSVSNQLI